MRSRLAAVWIGALVTMVPSTAAADWTVRPFFGAALGPRHGFVDLEQTSGPTRSWCWVRRRGGIRARSVWSLT